MGWCKFALTLQPVGDPLSPCFRFCEPQNDTAEASMVDPNDERAVEVTPRDVPELATTRCEIRTGFDDARQRGAG